MMLLTAILLLLLFSACSTTKVVPEGSYRLVENKVEITNSQQYPDYRPSDIDNYIRQKPNTYFFGKWNPFIYVYNWTSGKGNGWDRFVEKLGQAPVVFDPEQVGSSISNMETHLKYLGYYGSDVTDSISTRKKKATVTYNVTIGKQYPISRISYDIKDSTLRAIYMADTTASLLRPGLPISEKLLDDESIRATALFKENGYYSFSKNYFFYTADTLSVKDSALLEVSIREYTRNELERNAKPHKQFHIGKVTIYPVSDIIRYRAALSKRATLDLDTIDMGGGVYVFYDNKLNIRPSVLIKMNRVHPGDLYKASVVTNTYQRFSNLNLYSSVNVSLDQVTSDTVDCNIRLLPAKIQGYKLNLEASTNSTGLVGISPAISYYNRNIFRGGEWLNLSFSGNFQFGIKEKVRSTEFGTSATISLPTFLLLPDSFFSNVIPRTDFTLAYNYQQRPEYTRNMITAQYGYSWNSVSRKWGFQINPARVNIVKMSNQSPTFNEMIQNPFVKDSYIDHFDIGGLYTASYFSDPSINPKHTNLKANFRLELAGNLLSAFNKLMPVDSTGSRTIWRSPYAQYVRAETSVTQTWKFGKNEKLALAARFLAGGGFAYGNSNALPFEQLFWSGGSNSMRGWNARSLGPGTAVMDTTIAIPNQTGDMKLEANVEFRFPIFSIFYGALFFDAGNVWVKRELTDFDNYIRSVAFNTGLGVRLDIQFVVIRFDWGLKLWEPAAQRWYGPQDWFRSGGNSFQFGIGYPF
jgi:outer membrane protein assembly factor BamA